MQLMKQEFWKLFHSSRLYVVLGIGICFSIINIIDNARAIETFLPLIQEAAQEGWGISTHFEGFSLFVRWIGVNFSNLGGGLLNLLWPLLAAIPFGWSFCQEKNCNYDTQITTRASRTHYFIAKSIAVFSGGGIAVAFPLIFDLVVNSMIMPTCVPDVTTSVTPIFNYSFLSNLFYSKPWLYAVGVIGIRFLWGGTVASLCWLVTPRVRYQFVPMLFPFVLIMGMDLLHELFCEITMQPLGFSPLILAQIAIGAPTPGVLVLGVMGSMLAVSLAVGYRRVVKHELG